MANTASAKKMVRKIARRTAINRMRRSRMRQAVRRVETALAQGDNPTQALQAAQPLIARAAQKGLLHKNAARRKISRLARRVAAVTSSPS